MDPRILNLDLKTSLSALSDFALPRVCVVCGRHLLLSERHICMGCLSDLPLTHFENLSHNPMADEYNALIRKWASVWQPYSYACALFYYDSDSLYAHISRALKYGRNLREGRFFASMLGGRICSSPLFADVDLVLPVPLHWRRRLQRGYNQAEVIASQVAACLGVKMNTDVLCRKRRTSTQTKLSSADKMRNVAGAFGLRKGAEERLRGFRHILLVDDVFTTGSTMSEVHRALQPCLEEGVRVSLATLGYVEA